MPEGPLGAPRPFAESDPELNITFEGRDIPDDLVEDVKEVVDFHYAVDGPVKGPVGTLGSTITMAVNGNQITMGDMNDLKNMVEQETGEKVYEIEAIC